MDTLRTPLYDWHTAHGGRMVEFGGWEMPVQYTSIVEEHQATRRACALFDISHMGRLRFTGADAAGFLEHVLTRRVSNLRPGAIRYSLITNERGGILDDVLVYHLPPPEKAHLLVVNASNRIKILDWLEQQPRSGLDVRWNDETRSTAMIAVQGPAALRIANRLLAQGVQVDSLKYYSAMTVNVARLPALVSRTGYTGEDGCELIVPAELAQQIWVQLLESGEEQGVRPAGLGARDTLRLEAAMPLYGHELSEDINPFEADLAFAVQLEGRTFPGAAALASMAASGPARRRVGLALDGRRVPREGYAVLQATEPVGRITSGTFSPTLNHPIALALVDAGQADVGRELLVDIRGSQTPARIVSLPFYRSGT
jgi:aminomethyltransferase